MAPVEYDRYRDSYSRVVQVQGHRHSEPICCDPICQAYLTPTQMDAAPCVDCGKGWNGCAHKVVEADCPCLGLGPLVPDCRACGGAGFVVLSTRNGPVSAPPSTV